MAISGTGTENDPYIITTYDELVEKAVESDVYVKVGNDINIIDEYPDGDMPTLTVNAYIDGDGKVISNWYKTSESTIISYTASPATIKNMKIRNIYSAVSNRFANRTTETTTPMFEDCEISGVLLSGRFVNTENSVTITNRCSVNLLLKGSASFVRGDRNANQKDCRFYSSYIKLKSESSSGSLFVGSNGSKDSYFEIDASNFYNNSTLNTTFDNCVFDLTSTSTFTFNISSSSVSPSIINLTKAPNCTPQNSLLGVTDTNWLDVNYLSSIGFNAG